MLKENDYAKIKSDIYLHATGEEWLLVKDTFIVLHQVIQFVSQLQGEGLEGRRLSTVHHQTRTGLIQGGLQKLLHILPCSVLVCYSPNCFTTN